MQNHFVFALGWYIKNTDNYNHVTMVSGGLAAISSLIYVIVVVLHLIKRRYTQKKSVDIKIPEETLPELKPMTKI